MAQIALQGLRKTFGNVVAVADVTFTIDDGTFAVLLGPSGCGKTTTLNLIAGLEETTAGLILFDGEEVQDLPPHKRDIAMVFQSYALYPNRSVRDNIGFPLRMRRVNRNEIERRVNEVARRLGIAELLERRPRALSGGQQQRVALARAIIRRPRAFLLDEPLSNLDAKLRADMRFELKGLQRDLGGTFVHVTHDQAEAMSLADVLIVMDKGLVQQIGPPLTVYQQPANVFVATFVGIPTMNLVAGEINGGTFRAPGWEYPLNGVQASGPVTLGLRSEDLTAEPSSNGAPAKVRLVEQLGSDALVDIEIEFGRLVGRAPADTPLAPGDPVTLRVNPRRIHLFDAHTGVRRAANDGPPVPASAST
jgi:ABC-type sugar transport system ATPase subunit